jgi:hypothetical protein
MTPELIKTALAQAWNGDTSAESDWTDANPAYGQCAVTSLVVQDHLGGELICGRVTGGSHYWNMLPSGEEIDLTKQQFKRPFVPQSTEISSREHVLADPHTRQRYELLSDRVRQALAK